jgi:hypothetical protein
MTSWIISHDLIRANEEETVRATRYAHHRADTYRRPGRFLASLLHPWMSRIPTPRHLHTAPRDPTPAAPNLLYLTVFDLGIDDTSTAPDAPVRPAASPSAAVLFSERNQRSTPSWPIDVPTGRKARR